jgi:hypothetical protein
MMADGDVTMTLCCPVILVVEVTRPHSLLMLINFLTCCACCPAFSQYLFFPLLPGLYGGTWSAAHSSVPGECCLLSLLFLEAVAFPAYPAFCHSVYFMMTCAFVLFSGERPVIG